MHHCLYVATHLFLLSTLKLECLRHKFTPMLQGGGQVGGEGGVGEVGVEKAKAPQVKTQGH